jgi:hypothetical protein
MNRFVNGQSGNPAGRPKGAKNKIVKPLKAEIETFLSEQWPQIQTDFHSLEPKERIQMFERLARFVLPQPRETDMKINFNELSDAEIDSVINRMLDTYTK